MDHVVDVDFNGGVKINSTVGAKRCKSCANTSSTEAFDSPRKTKSRSSSTDSVYEVIADSENEDFDNEINGDVVDSEHTNRNGFSSSPDCTEEVDHSQIDDPSDSFEMEEEFVFVEDDGNDANEEKTDYQENPSDAQEDCLPNEDDMNEAVKELRFQRIKDVSHLSDEESKIQESMEDHFTTEKKKCESDGEINGILESNEESVSDEDSSLKSKSDSTESSIVSTKENKVKAESPSNSPCNNLPGTNMQLNVFNNNKVPSLDNPVQSCNVKTSNTECSTIEDSFLKSESDSPKPGVVSTNKGKSKVENTNSSTLGNLYVANVQLDALNNDEIPSMDDAIQSCTLKTSNAECSTDEDSLFKGKSDLTKSFIVLTNEDKVEKESPNNSKFEDLSVANVQLDFLNNDDVPSMDDTVQSCTVKTASTECATDKDFLLKSKINSTKSCIVSTNGSKVKEENPNSSTLDNVLVANMQLDALTNATVLSLEDTVLSSTVKTANAECSKDSQNCFSGKENECNNEIKSNIIDDSSLNIVDENDSSKKIQSNECIDKNIIFKSKLLRSPSFSSSEGDNFDLDSLIMDVVDEACPATLNDVSHLDSKQDDTLSTTPSNLTESHSSDHKSNVNTNDNECDLGNTIGNLAQGDVECSSENVSELLDSHETVPDDKFNSDKQTSVLISETIDKNVSNFSSSTVVTEDSVSDSCKQIDSIEGTNSESSKQSVSFAVSAVDTDSELCLSNSVHISKMDTDSKINSQISPIKMLDVSSDSESNQITSMETLEVRTNLNFISIESSDSESDDERMSAVGTSTVDSSKKNEKGDVCIVEKDLTFSDSPGTSKKAVSSNNDKHEEEQIILDTTLKATAVEQDKELDLQNNEDVVIDSDIIIIDEKISTQINQTSIPPDDDYQSVVDSILKEIKQTIEMQEKSTLVMEKKGMDTGEMESEKAGITIVNIDDLVTSESRTQETDSLSNEVQSSLNAANKRKLDDTNVETEVKKVKKDDCEDKESSSLVNSAESSVSNSLAEFLSESKSIKQLNSTIDDNKDLVTEDLREIMDLDKFASLSIEAYIEDNFQKEYKETLKLLEELEKNIVPLSKNYEGYNMEYIDYRGTQRESFIKRNFNPKVHTRTVGVNVKIYKESDIKRAVKLPSTADNSIAAVDKLNIRCEKTPKTEVKVELKTEASDSKSFQSTAKLIPNLKFKDTVISPIVTSQQIQVRKQLVPRIITQSNRPGLSTQVINTLTGRIAAPNVTVTSNNRFISIRGRPPGNRPVVILPSNSSTYSKSNQYIDLTKEEQHKMQIITPAGVPTPSVAKATMPGMPNTPNVLVPLREYLQFLPQGSKGPTVIQQSNLQRPTIIPPLPSNLRTLTYFVPQNSGIGGQPIQPFIQPSNQQVQFVIRVTNPGSTPTVNPVVNTISKPPAVPQQVTSNPRPSSGLILISHTSKHPAPFPPSPHYPDTKGKAVPPKPSLKGSKNASGIVLSWNMCLFRHHANIASYQLFAYQETEDGPVDASLWKKVGDVNALPLPMACTLTQFVDKNRYYFTVRAVDTHQRFGPFSDPVCILYEKESDSSSKK